MPLIGKTVIYIWCLIILGAYGDQTFPSQEERTCSPSTVVFHQCKREETCTSIGVDGRGVCRCKKDYQINGDGSCQPVPKEPIPTAAPNMSNSSERDGFGFKLILWLIIPVLIAGAIGGIVYTGRQKMWLNRLYRMRVRSYNNVLVSSQDEDDPPIA